jgi:hypothetical protein
MTLPTKDRLAAELRKVAAQCNPDRTALYLELRAIGAHKFADRVRDGEFDASREESEDWAREQTDPQVIALMQAMGIAPDRSKDQ